MSPKMTKNHPFENGNKRVAVMALIYFLYKNDHWITVGNDELYEFANEVAASEAADYLKTLLKIRKFLNKHVIKQIHPQASEELTL